MLKIGETLINKIYKGDTQAKRIYKGRMFLFGDKPAKKNYTPLEYIKCDDSKGAYIDTEAIVNGVDICFQYDADFASDNSLFGARDYGASSRFGLITQPGNKLHPMPPGSDFGDYKQGEKQYLTMGAYFNWVITIDGQTMRTSGSWSTQRTCWLFRENQTGIYRPGWGIRLYYCKLYYNNELIRDLIPVLDENNVPCLYDKVTDSFFYNKGSGTFLYE